MKTTSGIRQCWKLWRHCCGRYGFFPFIVACTITLGALLSLISSVGCDFIEVDVGFQPVNKGWNFQTQSANFGILFYHNETMDHENKYRNALHNGCQLFSEEFKNKFVNNDRTFKMVRAMTLISAISCGIATVSNNCTR